jgi:hypothetical protein
MCHNCNVSTSFFNFLKQVDPNLSRQYTLERFRNETVIKKITDVTNPDLLKKPTFKTSLNIPSIDSLSPDHFARVYTEARMIPKSKFKELYYADDFKSFVKSLGIDIKDLFDNDKRLIIPFYDQEKNLIALQGRALGQSKLRYITLKLDEDNPKVFGLDKVNFEEKIYVVEGPIDSLFLDNSIAMADSNLESSIKYVKKENIVLVFDNEPRNKEIVDMMGKAIDKHYNVVVWPDYIEEKDINDMILKGGWNQDEIMDIIKERTFLNLRAKMEFITWKRT